MKEEISSLKPLLIAPLNQVLFACIILFCILKQPIEFTNELLTIKFPRDIISTFASILLTVIPCYLCIQKRFIEKSNFDLDNLLDLLGKTKLTIIYLVNAFSEELLFRVALLGLLSTIMDVKNAILISSIFFTVAHYRHIKCWKLMILFTWMGIILGNLYISTGSIITIVLAHFTHNMLLTIPQIKKEKC